MVDDDDLMTMMIHDDDDESSKAGPSRLRQMLETRQPGPAECVLHKQRSASGFYGRREWPAFKVSTAAVRLGGAV